MKKVSVFMLILVLLFGLIACSSGGNEESSTIEENGVTKLTFWAPLSGGDGDFMKELVTKFNEENKEVQVELLNLKAEEYYTKIRTSVTSQQAPDVALAHASKLAELQSAKLIESIEKTSSDASIDWTTFSENIVNATIIDNEHYAIPLDTHALIMFANKKILDEAGLLSADGKPSIEPGAEGFIEFLKQVKKNSPAGTFPLAATSNGDSPLRMWWTFYTQQGGEMLNDAGTKAAFNNEKSLEALNLLNEMIEGELWPKNIKNGGELFTAQKAAIHMNGVWMTGALEQNKGLEFVALPIPQIFDQKATWGDSHLFVIPKQEKQTEEKKVASLTFANWITEHSASWAKAGHVPSKPEILESSEFKDLAYRSDYSEIGNYVSYMPNSPKLSAINDVLKKHLNLFMNGQSDAKDTLENAEKEVNELLSK
ncbi:ABC transporter substrate-binding protein [Neobacillus sp. DY30]|uniref:ABC transporter substrate-binding protein n=1 Tax=Neobacillus sp. DY30 TaxID=3047871 RepID=UPI0024BFDE9A|nr:ABC transporter substrate-binding protein [Neobacillus sp. DY30]WHX99020.1 ABC transporter substrate-binding protein [Neobacillus sp. DY30]